MIENDTLFIKKEYIIRTDLKHHIDISFKDEYQDYVYESARKLTPSLNDVVVDIGCGSGYKLVKYFNEYKTIGYEIEPCYSYLKKTYANKTWKYANFDIPLENGNTIICADVIEHLEDPLLLVEWVEKSSFDRLIISTPDRDRVYGFSQNGPPTNVTHVREWTYTEFQDFIGNYFKIINHFYSPHKIELCNQIIVCVKKYI